MGKRIVSAAEFEAKKELHDAICVLGALWQGVFGLAHRVTDEDLLDGVARFNSWTAQTTASSCKRSLPVFHKIDEFVNLELSLSDFRAKAEGYLNFITEQSNLLKDELKKL